MRAGRRIVPKPTRVALAVRLRHLVDGCGGTRVLAARLGVPSQSVTNWLRADVAPELAVIYSIAQELHISPSWLLLGEGPRLISELGAASSVDHVRVGLVKEIAIRAKVTFAFADALLPPTSDLVRQAIEPLVVIVEDNAETWRRLRRRAKTRAEGRPPRSEPFLDTYPYTFGAVHLLPEDTLIGLPSPDPEKDR